MTRQKFDFQSILQDARQIYHHPPQNDKCPEAEVLLDYLHHELPGDAAQTVAQHIQRCERCRIMLLKMDVDRSRWERRLNAAYQAELARLRATAEPEYVLLEWGELIAEYYVEPPEAKVVNTARAQTFEDSRTFETDLGKITIQYSWGEQGDTNKVFLWLGWEAELSPEGTFAIRLLEPDTDTVRLEISPDTIEQTDEATFTVEQLGFNPLRTPWDIAITVFKRPQ